MFKRLVGRFFEKKRRLRRELACRLFSVLDQHGSLVLDGRAIALLGGDRKEALLLVCYLAVRERLHLVSDHAERLVVLSNDEFIHRLRPTPDLDLSGADMPKTDLPVLRARSSRQRLPVLPNTLTVDLIAEDDGAALCPPPSGEPRISVPVVETPSAADNEDDGWFTIDVAPGEFTREGAGKKFPSGRQSLPDRPREPWGIQEGVQFDPE